LGINTQSTKTIVKPKEEMQKGIYFHNKIQKRHKSNKVFQNFHIKFEDEN